MNETTRKVGDLHVHPFNLEIYGEPDDGLSESLENFGLQHPIEVAPDGGIVSGARRWTAAKKLGWTHIKTQTPDIDFSNDVAVQKYTLLANAYRKQKTSYMQKREADAYRRLLDTGGITRDEIQALARQNDEGPREPRAPGRNYDRAASLAARAASLGTRTYEHFCYVLDPPGAEEEIDKARERGEVTPKQAGALKRELQASRDKLRSDNAGVETTSDTLRKKIRQAKADHTFTEEERRQRDANNAAVEANKKLRAGLNALETLKSEGHANLLDQRHALVLAGTVSDIVDAIKGMTNGTVEEGRRPVEIVA